MNGVVVLSAGLCLAVQSGMGVPQVADLCVASGWQVRAHEGSVTFRRTAAEIVAVGVATGKTDTAWAIESKRFPVDPGSRSYLVTYRAKATYTQYGELRPGNSWSPAVEWFATDGHLIERAPFAAFVPSGGFSRVAATGPVPKDAASAMFRFGADIPDLPKGAEVAFRDFAVEFLPRTAHEARAKLLERGCRRPIDVRVSEAEAKRLAFPPERSKGLPHYSLRDDGQFLVDGKPYFPIGIYAVCRREFNGMDFDKAFKDLAKAGFDFAHTYTDTYAPEFYRAARKHGFRLQVAVRKYPGRPFLDLARFEPAVMMWYLGDDTATWWKPEEVFGNNAACKAADPFRLTCQADCLSAGMPYSRYADYVGATDVFMPEIYPFRWGAPDLPLDHDPERMCVADVVRDMKTFRRVERENSDGRPRAVMPILQAFKGWTLWKKWPTREQLFATVFASLVHGANGITWYTYGGFYNKKRDAFDEGITSTAERWQLMTDVVGRIRELRGPLTARTGIQPTVEHLTGPTVDGFGNDSVSCLLKRFGGKAYLLAVNGTTEKVGVCFDIPSVGPLATVLHEGRALPVEKGRMADSFDSLGVHVYVMDDLVDETSNN